LIGSSKLAVSAAGAQAGEFFLQRLNRRRSMRRSMSLMSKSDMSVYSLCVCGLMDQPPTTVQVPSPSRTRARPPLFADIEHNDRNLVVAHQA
jgi:hypothetical protein